MQKISVEELVIDDSFINYCLKKNTDDVEYWQVFTALHPEDEAILREARDIVLSLSLVMQQQLIPTQTSNNFSEKQNRKINFKKILAYAAIVAGLIFSVIAVQQIASNKTQVLARQNFNAGNAQTYTTANARHKQMELPDGTHITLNAGSSINIAENFGKKNRDVYLDGEAVFDVTHNAKLPFVVHTAFYNVKVLGTLFNVKAYGTERNSETSLLRGKVEIILKDNKKIPLTPNNKVVFSIDEKGINKKESQPDSIITINPISYTKDSVINETAWAQNRLEITNETFEQIKTKLERWYDVQITFADKEVAAYAFSASFEKETIEEALKALQYSYHFNYKKDGKNITISK